MQLHVARSQENAINSETSEEEGDSNCLENLHWCSCKACVIFEAMQHIECKCCHESHKLLGNKLVGRKCITHHDNFKILYLNCMYMASMTFKGKKSTCLQTSKPEKQHLIQILSS